MWNCIHIFIDICTLRRQGITMMKKLSHFAWKIEYFKSSSIPNVLWCKNRSAVERIMCKVKTLLQCYGILNIFEYWNIFSKFALIYTLKEKIEDRLFQFNSFIYLEIIVAVTQRIISIIYHLFFIDVETRKTEL